MNSTQTIIDKWEQYYEECLKENYLFPNEYVIRSFLGSYPNLKIDRNYQGKNVCDISCGDGRNIILLNKLKLNIYATEISEKICRIIKEKLLKHPDITHFKEIKKGFNSELPFEDNFFDYALSWNAIYYMRDKNNAFNEHISEHARILKRDGYLICSVPTPNCFSLENATSIGDNLIQLNPKFNWGGRNIHKDTIYYRFDSFDHIEKLFGNHFYNFQKAGAMT